MDKIVKISSDGSADVVGTSFFGSTFGASVNEMEELFGEPMEFADDKTQYEWWFTCADRKGGETVVTVYNYKGEEIRSKDETVSWHIGGWAREETAEFERYMKRDVFGVE